MKKIFFTISGLSAFLLAIGLPIWANAATVTYNSDVTLSLPNGVSLTVLNNSLVEQIVVNDNSTLTITVGADTNIIIRSNNRYDFSTAVSSGTPSASESCSDAYNQLTITSSGAGALTVTVNTGTTCSAPPTHSGGGGGGGAGITTPSITADSLIINNGDAETKSSKVTLKLFAINAAQMMVSNSANFTGASWQLYTNSISWTLDPEPGVKTVYAKFKSSSGYVSSVATDTITLSESAEPTETPVETPVTTPVTTTIPEGSLVKESGVSSVYLISDNKKLPIPNAKVFEANGYKWSDIVEVSDLSGYATGDSVGYPADYDFKDGMLVKGSDSKVYVISNSQIRWIINEAIFLGLGYQWSNIYEISDAKIAEYGEGDSITSTATHPDGTLVKYLDSSLVYVLEDGKKRWVTDEQTFNDQGYDWDLIIEIPTAEAYVDGENIGLSGIVGAGSQVLGVYTSNLFTTYLYLGSVGNEVRLLQQTLKDLGYFPADQAITGYFGPLTKQAVIEFQKTNNIDPLGVVGPKTREKLNSL